MMPKKSARTQRSSHSSKISPTDQHDTNKGRALPQLSSFLAWLDEHILLLLAGFLIAFIPLYPKIPLADLIPGYIVRLRLEDLFVAFTVGVLGVQVLRRKVEWKTPLTWLIGLYAVVGLLSTVSGVLITQTIPAEPIHIGKSLLHYFRYLQYFSLFFIAFAAIKTRKHVYILLSIIAATVLAIAVYGFGQRYYYWPVYSTMNREFSKGMRLVLTEHARVQSTFGGHYDMSAFLVIMLPLIMGIFFSVKKWLWKISMLGIFSIGTWLLIVGASRTSVGVFGLTMTAMIAIFALQQKGWLTKVWWGFSRQVLFTSIVVVLMMRFGDSVYDRLLQTLEGYPTLHYAYHTANDRRIHFNRYYINPIAVRLGLAEMQLPAAERPENSITTDDVDRIIVSSDTQPSPAKDLPADVFEDIPDIEWIATEEGGVATVIAVEKERTFSDNASRYGLSMAIRLDTLWPRAIAGFQRNPILGSGYATLTKETARQFTEAESTDNNFLRTLGETGLLGFVSFYGTVGVALFLTIKTLLSPTKDLFLRAILSAYIAATIGLLLNAITIDVFAASKVAFSYWALTGIVIAIILKLTPPSVNDSKTHDAL